MNGIDLSTTSDIRLGGTTVSAVYLGTNKIWPTTHNYANDYFTIESLEDSNSFKFVHLGGETTNIYYSLDNGSTWKEYLAEYNTQTSITLNTGNKMLLKATSDTIDYYIDSTNTFNVYGNLHSLLYADNFRTINTFPANFGNVQLFKKTKIVDASNLILPATTLKQNCYTLMFEDDSNLVSGPVLPAPILVDYCYELMFYGCTSLNSITCLATDISATHCTDGWVTRVPTGGTFIKAANMTDWTTGFNGIPSGWTVQDA